MEGSKRTRSRTGCQTCRRRKVRCDERHPACGACLRLHLPCSFLATDQMLGTRKTRQTRQARYHVRFVTSRNSQTWSPSPASPSRRTQRPPDASPPLTPSGPSSDESSSLSPYATTPSQALAVASNTVPAVPRLGWTTDDTMLGTAMDNNPSKFYLGQNSATLSDAGMLDAIGFHADLSEDSNFDALWDTLPAYDDFLAGFGYPSGVSEDHQGASNIFEAAVVRPEPHAPSLVPPESSLLSVPVPATAAALFLAPVQAPTAGAMVSMKPDDREPLQHFLSTMVQFVKLRSSNSDNIYCYIFTNMALTHAPLYEAILAWDALHKAHVKSASTADAELRYQYASRLLYEDTQASAHVDLTVVTIWFLLQYELFLAKGVARFLALLDYAANVIRPLFETHSSAVIHDRLGPVAVRVVIWLSAYDARAAPFGGGCHLLRCLKAHLSDQDTFLFVAVDRDNNSDYNVGGPSLEQEDHMHGIFGAQPSAVETTEMQACLRLALRLNVVRGSCSLLGRWRDSEYDRDERVAAWTVVRTSIILIKNRLEANDVPAVKAALRVAAGDIDVAPSELGALQFNWTQLVAKYYGCVLIYHTSRPASLSPDHPRDARLPTAADSAASIIRLTRHVSLSRPNSPHCIWSQLLFEAGIETTDPIYQSWAVDALLHAEMWSPNLRKTRQLLERIIKLRRDVQGPCDIAAVMEAAGDVFIL